MKKIIIAAYKHVDKMSKKADGMHGNGPWWHGWAIRESFIAGAEWQQKNRSKKETKLK